MENSNNQTNDERMAEHRREQLEEYGVTEEQMQKVKAYLEANGYKVDDSYFLSINLAHDDWNNRAFAHLMFNNNNQVLMSTTSSWFSLVDSTRFLAEMSKCVELLAGIKAIAPNLVDPTYRDQRREAAAKRAQAALKAKVEAFNAKPKTEEVFRSNKHKVVITLIRGEADFEYLKNHGSRDNFPASLTIESGDYKNEHFWPKSHITSAGSVQKKFFVRDYKHIMSEEAAELLAESLVYLNKKLAAAHGGN